MNWAKNKPGEKGFIRVPAAVERYSIGLVGDLIEARVYHDAVFGLWNYSVTVGQIHIGGGQESSCERAKERAEDLIWSLSRGLAEELVGQTADSIGLGKGLA
jgi:hypothetical protein